MPNRQTEDQRQPGNRNPGAISPEQNDDQQADQPAAEARDPNIEQRKGTRTTRTAQQNTPAEDADVIADDDAGTDVEDDEEEDGSGGHI